jgi:hypothetical protein
VSVSDAPRHNQLWAWASDSDKREESRERERGRKLELRCGTPRRLPIGRSHTDSNGVVAWYWESVNPNLTFPTQLNAAVRCRGIPPASRLQAEEDVKYHMGFLFQCRMDIYLNITFKLFILLLTVSVGGTLSTVVIQSNLSWNAQTRVLCGIKRPQQQQLLSSL